MNTPRRPDILVLALAGAAYCVLCGLLWNYTQDDAFISFRYALNLIRGDGLVYNPGEPPVEGYTNFLWTVLMAGFMAAGAEPELTSKLLGVLLGLGTLALTLVMARRALPESRWAWGVPLLLGLTPAFAMHAVSGLETSLFTFLLVAGFVLLQSERPSRKALMGGGVALGLAALTRPEGLGFLALMGLGQFVENRFRPGGGRRVRALVAIVLPAVILVGAFVAWRWTYYGELLPNTYHAKLGGGLAVADGWEYVGRFFGEYGGLLLPVLAALALVRRPAGVRAAAVVTIGGIGMVVWEGGDWMALYRFMVPVLPFLLLVAVRGVESLHKDFLARHGGPARLFGPGLLLLIGGLSLLTLRGEVEQAFEKRALYESAHRQWGRWLGANTPEGEKIALTDIGQFGYFSDAPVLDLAGLTDPVIARAPGGLHDKSIDPDYVYEQHPAFMIFIVKRRGQSLHIQGTEQFLHQDPRLEERYAGPVAIPYRDDYFYWLYVREDLRGEILPLPANAMPAEGW